MQLTKVAPPGFERETEIVVARALTSVTTAADLVVKSKGKILQNFVAFSEYMNFTINLTLCSKCQIDGEDFINFCGLLGKYEL